MRKEFAGEQSVEAILCMIGIKIGWSRFDADLGLKVQEFQTSYLTRGTLVLHKQCGIVVEVGHLVRRF